MSVPCESAAAYVLGALPAAERSSFEQHLAGCQDCRQTVGELAGLPGLLARVSPDDLSDPAPVPDTLVPRLLREVRRSGRRRRLLVGSVAAAAVALAVVGTATIVDRSQPQAPTSVAMRAVVPSPVTASAAFVRHAWGTEITMECRYADRSDWSQPYALVAVDDHGTTYQIGTWVVGPGKTASISGSVPVQPEHIDRVEIRLMSGTPILRLRPTRT